MNCIQATLMKLSHISDSDWVAIQTRERLGKELDAQEELYRERLAKARKKEAEIKKQMKARAIKRPVGSIGCYFF